MDSINQIRQKKVELEEIITRELRKFELETELVVDAFECIRDDKRRVANIWVKVRL